MERRRREVRSEETDECNSNWLAKEEQIRLQNILLKYSLPERNGQLSEKLWWFHKIQG